MISPVVRTVAASFALTLATNLPALARDCAKASDQATLNECAGKEFEAADRDLNESYKAIEQRLKTNAGQLKLLVTAQRAWIAFRDAECSFSASATEGGSVYPMVVSGCRTGLTQQRTEQLKAYLNCEEGDLSCPVPAAE